MNLTDEQLRATRHISGNLQLIACAGSGKTEVVAQRVVSLLRPAKDGGGGASPENIVAFTFTERAATELKDRDLYLFDIWGYVPGSGPGGYWQQFQPPPSAFATFESILGDRWLGTDIGEPGVGGVSAQGTFVEDGLALAGVAVDDLGDGPGVA